MPELPEVQTTGDSLKPLLSQRINKVQIYQPKLRWPMPEDLPDLVGFSLTHIERRAKYLLLTFSQGEQSKTLLVHLGMSGSLQQHIAGCEKRKHDHLIIDFADENGQITQLHYHDPRRFGMVLWLDAFEDKLISKLGVEPLETTFTGQYLFNYINARNKPITRPIKAVIMEQAVVVGVGNIYATEALFLASIHPLTPANLLTLAQLNSLVAFIKEVLTISIEKGGSTLRDFTVGDGRTGYFQQTLRVYGRKNMPCPICQTPVDSVKIAQRASTFCPTCQPLPKTTSQK